ncbi:MAG: 2-amino-4-hydroxy-6-hydroxymethyldihydropteridine diphosphokinase [Nitrospirae bacterium GWD2_57_9]|nr:MAG: 2-amino-4-hydroxy-6-hydroxymethyldihydropteridine diphosphokinase [Nitrospirae bacterium GWD2_57_9]OGW45595.1 MAG: 2-amino-4-hydroxy-6-hydroxymethyldihydropteridine diphosphokinase [Nitrospirae bacterium GWC2_57_9]
MPVTAYIGIGSNVGDKKANCLKAVELLKQAGNVLALSALYYTEPVGYHEQEDFINAVAAFETERSPRELLDLCLRIEDMLGRKRTVRWGPRTIDLDILLYGDVVVNLPDLVIPHPLMATRKFVLVPLAEIAPQAAHPLVKKNASKLLSELKDTSTVMKCRPDRTGP